jgi:hypothetical protein
MISYSETRIPQMVDKNVVKWRAAAHLVTVLEQLHLSALGHFERHLGQVDMLCFLVWVY